MNIKEMLELHKKWLNNEKDGVRADLSGADLSSADLRHADLRHADLSRAKLSSADLSWANLNGADLSRATLSCANLSGAKGLLSQSDYIKANFKTTNSGVIVYKTFSEHYSANPNWKLEPGQYITENVNSNRNDGCGCGVNVGTPKYIIDRTKNEVWECLIEWADLAGVVVPYNTDGKIRAERVKLIRTITREELKGLIE